MKRVLANQKATADSGQLLSDLIEIWGGTRQLGADLYAEFQAAAPGSMTRQRILEMIQRLVITNTSNEISKPITPSDLDDDELERIALELTAKVTHGSAPAAAAGEEEGPRP